MVMRCLLLTASFGLLAFAAPVRAGDTGWFVIDEVSTGQTQNDTFVIKGTFSPIADACSSLDTELLIDKDDPNNVNFDGITKLTLAAFMSGKQVKGHFTGCINGRVSIIRLLVCADASCA